jgi:hypothetical protein
MPSAGRPPHHKSNTEVRNDDLRIPLISVLRQPLMLLGSSNRSRHWGLLREGNLWAKSGSRRQFRELSIAQFDRPEKIRPIIRRWRNGWAETARTAALSRLRAWSRHKREAIIPLYGACVVFSARIPKRSTTILTSSKRLAQRALGPRDGSVPRRFVVPALSQEDPRNRPSLFRPACYHQSFSNFGLPRLT